MGKIGQIAEGVLNLAIKKDMVEKIAAARRIICNGCDHISLKHETVRPDVHCTACGCTLATKTRSLETSCPYNFWPAITKEDNNGNPRE